MRVRPPRPGHRRTNELDDGRTFEYDHLGRLIERTNRNGRIIRFEHGALGRLLEESWIDDDSALAFAWDALGRLTSVDNSGTDGTPNFVLTSQYDHLGRRTRLSAVVDEDDDFTNEYAYDTLGRATRFVQHARGNAVEENRPRQSR